MKLILLLVFQLSIHVNAQSVIDSCVVYVPNIVTTSCGSVFKDDFDLEVYSNCSPISFSIQVYNRWGEIIYEADKITDWFDMTKEKDGVYIYIIKVDFGSGEREIKGHVTKLD